METPHQQTQSDRVVTGRLRVQYPTLLSGEGQKMTKEEKEDLSRLIDDEKYAGDKAGRVEVPGTGTSLVNNDGTQTMPDQSDATEASVYDSLYGEWRLSYQS